MSFNTIDCLNLTIRILLINLSFILVRFQVGAAYDCLPEIAQMFMEQDPSMLYLDIAVRF